MARPCKNNSQHPELLSFGEAIRTIRLDKGLSQEKLAELTGVDRSYMGGIERGEHNVSLINIKRISNALNLPISNIFQQAKL